MQTKINFPSCAEKQTTYVHVCTYIHTHVAPQPRTVTNRAVEAEKEAIVHSHSHESQRPKYEKVSKLNQDSPQTKTSGLVITQICLHTF